MRLPASPARLVSLLVTAILWCSPLAAGPAAVPTGEESAGVVLRSLNGEPRRLSDWEGRLRLVNFWATWCGPCRDEMPLLENAYRRYRHRNFVIIGIALDDPRAVSRFASRLGVSYPLMVIDTAAGTSLMERYGNRRNAVPFSVLLSPDGDVLDRHIGAVDETGLAHLLKQHLEPPTPDTRTTGIPKHRGSRG